MSSNSPHIPGAIPRIRPKTDRNPQQPQLLKLPRGWRPPDPPQIASSKKSKLLDEAPVINPSKNSATAPPKSSNPFRDAYMSLPPRSRVYLSLGLFGFACFGVGVTYYLEDKFPAPARQTTARSRIEQQLDEEAILEQALKEEDTAFVAINNPNSSTDRKDGSSKY